MYSAITRNCNSQVLNYVFCFERLRSVRLVFLIKIFPFRKKSISHLHGATQFRFERPGGEPVASAAVKFLFLGQPSFLRLRRIYPRMRCLFCA
jgi:hypothetical protein